MTIALVNLTKGGVTKTTIATNLSMQFKRDGENVNLIDLDVTQEAAYSWSLENEVNGFLNPKPDKIMELLEDTESVNIFDTGGYDLVSTQALICSSNAVLIPTSMSSIETKAFIKLAGKIEAIKDKTGIKDLNLIVVPTKIHHATSSEAINEYFESLKELGYKIAPSISYRVSYQRAFDNGGSVVGGSDAKARTEIKRLTEYVKGVCYAY